jgi:hypothetical protein
MDTDEADEGSFYPQIDADKRRFPAGEEEPRLARPPTTADPFLLLDGRGWWMYDLGYREMGRMRLARMA